MAIYTSIDQIIGKTPLLELTGMERREGLRARVLAKLESRNPGGSAKDRIARNMIDEAERAGLLRPESRPEKRSNSKEHQALLRQEKKKCWRV